MKRVNVSQLKARLSEYLARVRAGDTVVVCARDVPVARLVPYDDQVDDFVVPEPRRPARFVKTIRGVKPRRPVDVVRLLRESRDQR